MAVRESAIPQQGVGGPVTAQDINGKDCVQAQEKSRGKGEPAGDGGDDLSHKGLDPVNQRLIRYSAVVAAKADHRASRTIWRDRSGAGARIRRAPRP